MLWKLTLPEDWQFFLCVSKDIYFQIVHGLWSVSFLRSILGAGLSLRHRWDPLPRYLCISAILTTLKAYHPYRSPYFIVMLDSYMEQCDQKRPAWMFHIPLMTHFTDQSQYLLRFGSFSCSSVDFRYRTAGALHGPRRSTLCYFPRQARLRFGTCLSYVPCDGTPVNYNKADVCTFNNK